MVETKMEIGSPLRLKEDFESMKAGTLGIANSVIEVDKTYVLFMPCTELKVYAMDADRFEVVPEEEAKEMGMDKFIPEVPEEFSGEAAS